MARAAEQPGRFRKVAVVAEYPISLKNGAGFRVLLEHLEEYPRDRIISIYLKDRVVFVDREIAAQGVLHQAVPCRGSGIPRLISIFFGFLSHILTQEAGTTYILMPNSPADLVLAWLYSWFRRSTLIWWMDDFVDRADFSGLKRALGRRMRRQAHLRSKIRITVSPEMKRFFEGLYPVPVHAVIGKRVHQLGREKTRVPARPIRLAYVGSYEWTYLDPLRALAQFARSESFHLDLYGVRPAPQEILAPGKVEYQGALADDRFNSILADYDYTLLAYSFSGMTKSFVAHSFPSKLVDYLGTGVPVWTISPPGVACLEEIRRHEVGPMLHDLDDLPKALEDLRSVSQDQYLRWSRNTLAWAREEFLFQPGQFLGLLEPLKETSK